MLEILALSKQCVFSDFTELKAFRFFVKIFEAIELGRIRFFSNLLVYKNGNSRDTKLPYTRVNKRPYTRVNKRIRLFPKLQGNMRLLPNMRLTTPQNCDAFLVARVHDKSQVVEIVP